MVLSQNLERELYHKAVVWYYVNQVDRRSKLLLTRPARLDRSCVRRVE